MNNDRLSFHAVSVPGVVGHNNVPLRIYTISYLKRKTAKGHSRLIVFCEKGVKCANPDCNRIGKYVLVTRDPGGGIHKDVYTKDFVLMTIDHINPRANGGGEELDNKQPMCEPCNSKKGHSIPKHIKEGH